MMHRRLQARPAGSRGEPKGLRSGRDRFLSKSRGRYRVLQEPLVALTLLTMFLSCHRRGLGEADWRSVNDFTYQLQNVDLEALGDTRFDLCVIDYSLDGSEEQRLAADQIAGLRDSPGGHKLVLA